MHEDLRIDKVNGSTLVKEMARDVEVMMKNKVDAITRIMIEAEKIALDHKVEDKVDHKVEDKVVPFHNSAKLNILAEDDDGGDDEYGRYLSQDRAR